MATLKLRRGSSFTSPQISEPFFNTYNNTMLLGFGTTDGEHITLVKLGANTGSIELTGDLTASNVTLTGDLSARNVSLSGNIIIGDEIQDNITVQGQFSGSLIPSASNEYDLGSTTKKWRNLHVVNGTIDNVTLPGSNIVSSSQQISDYNVYLEINGDNVVSESAQINHDATTGFVNNEHINHSDVLINAGDGMSGGGNIVSSRTLGLNTGSDHFLEGVKKKINTEDVVSGSIQVDHDATTNFVANEHINHTSVTMTAGAGLTGGGTIASTRTFNVESANNGIAINADNIELVNDSTTFTSGVKAKLYTETVVSGSVQVDHDSTTNFVANEHIDHTSVTITAGAGLTGGGTIASTRTLNVESANNGITINADNIELVNDSTTFTSGVKAKLNTETVVSGSQQVIDFVTASDLDMGGNKVLFGNVYSAESDLPSASTYHGMFAHVHGTGKGYYAHNGGWIKLIDETSSDTGDLSEGSNLYYTDTRVKTKLNTENVISGSSQVPMGGDISGNADNATVNKVKGVSLTSDEATQISNINSVTISNTQWGYLGDSNQGISTTDNVVFADGDFTGDVQVTGNLTVLGSATEIQTSELRIEDKLITVASGSSDSSAADGAGLEIDGANKSLTWEHGTQQFVLNAKVSSSVGFKGEGGELTGIDTDQVTEAGNLYYTDARVKTKLNTETVISGSTQVNLNHLDTDDLSEGSNLYYTNVRVKSYINSQDVISGSSQVILNDADYTGFDTTDISEGNNLYYTNSRVKARLNHETVISGSSQVNADTIENFDSNVKDKLNVEDVISGSSQVNANTITNFDSNVKDKMNDDGVISGSSQLHDDLDLRYLEITGDNVFSQSAQIDHDSTTGFVANEHIDHSSITIGSGKGLIGGGNITTSRSLTLATGSQHFGEGVINALTGSGIISSSVLSSTSVQGQVRLTQNGTATNVTLNGLGTTNSPTFDGLTLTDVSALDNTHYTVFVSGSGGVVGKRTLATAAFYHVSSSISDGNTAVLGNAGAVKDYIDEALIAVGAGDITKVTAGLGMSGSTDSGEAVVAIDTGSQHFGSGVINALTGSGIVSGSSQISLSGFSTTNLSEGTNKYYTDARVKTKLNADGVVSGSTFSSPSQGTLRATINGDNTDIDLGLQAGDSPTFVGGNFTGDVQISGDLVVQGAATEIQVSELRIEDKLITVASGSANSSAANGAGLEIDRGSDSNITLKWNHSDGRLEVNDDFFSQGTISATSDIVAYVSSDERLKTEVKPIENPIQKINSISGNSFVWDEEKQNIYKGKDYGVIAQEIEKVLPELVNTREDGYKAVKYDRIVSLLIEGIKELSDEVNQLKEKINKE